MSVSSSTDSLVIVGDEIPKTNEGKEEVKPRPPEMKSMHVVSNVRNRYARTVVTSKYNNPELSAQQATFSIVLPDTAFIAGFVMEIKGKKYEAYVKEKEEAKQEYQAAVSRGQAAAHVEVNARDSNKFTVSVNVEPQSDVTFILTYEELLVRKHSKYEMIVNLHPGQLLEDLGVDIHINETRPIVHIETPALRSGNEITDKVTKNEYATIKKDDDGMVHISFHPTVQQQKDMAKALADKEKLTDTSEQTSNENKNNGVAGQFVIEYDVERDPLGGEVLVNDGYFVHFFAPTELKPIPKHVIFVLDVSGSMGGRKLKQLKEAMKVILNELNPEDYFNLVKFSDSISVLNSKLSWDNIEIPAESKLPQSFAVNAKNIKSVQNVVDHITDEGCTNIYDALIVGVRLTSKGILHLKDSHKKHKPQPIIVFLTDGQPNVSESDPKKIIEMVEKKNDCENKSAIFTLAFGDDADNEFLKELAIKNSGFLRNIYEAADASLQLQDFYKQISSPLLTNVNFKYSDDVKEVTKKKFDILFDGSEFVVAGKVDEMVDGFVLVEGSTLNGTNQFCPKFIQICPRPEVKEEYGNLERLWAYMTIKQLLDQKYEKKASDKKETEEGTLEKQPDESETKKDAAEKQALNLALKYSFVTPITSLVVVKPDEPAAVEQLQNDDGNNFICEMDLRGLDPVLHRMSSPRGPMSSPAFNPNDFICQMDLRGLPPARMMSCALYTSMPAPKMRSKKMKSNSLTGAISNFFKKSKDDSLDEHILLKSLDVECNVKNHVATTRERRKYLNSDDKPSETTFTIVLPDKAVFAEFLMGIDAEVFEANGRDKKQAKKEYKEAVSNGLNAALVNLNNSNKVNVTVNIMPQCEIIFTLMYTKSLESKNGKYEVCINLHREAQTEEIKVNVNLIEATPIKNVEALPLRSQNEEMNNEYVTIDRVNDNKVHVEFYVTGEQQEEIAAVLKSTDGNFSGEFIIEYEVEPDPSAPEDLVTNSNASAPFQYLVAVKNNN